MLDALSQAVRRAIAAPNWLEVCMVVDRRGKIYATSRVDDIVKRLGIKVVPFDEPLVPIARAAFEQYGKGSKHPAGLNYGDCMAYALAKHSGDLLLFKGNDFSHTDITPALA